jgi:type IV secretory pathway component VirB8
MDENKEKDKKKDPQKTALLIYVKYQRKLNEKLDKLIFLAKGILISVCLLIVTVIVMMLLTH